MNPKLEEKKYRGANAVAKTNHQGAEVHYISFGEYDPQTECDTYGVPDYNISAYTTYDEFTAAMSSPSCRVLYLTVLSYQLLPIT